MRSAPAEADAIARRIVELLDDETPQLLGENGGPPRRISPATSCCSSAR